MQVNPLAGIIVRVFISKDAERQGEEGWERYGDVWEDDEKRPGEEDGQAYMIQTDYGSLPKLAGNLRLNDALSVVSECPQD